MNRARVAPVSEGTAAGLLSAARQLAPSTLEEAAELLSTAYQERQPVLIWGGGRHQGYGHRVYPEMVLSTARLTRVVAWEPDDLTMVVEAGARVDEIEAMLAERRQTAALPEEPGEATIGGVVAAGISGYRRSRYGPTRDRVLEVTLVTGDGRIVRGGGRVVKNVSGYDLPRLATGSLGSLGLIGMICLKLWPLPETRVTVALGDPTAALRRLYRPVAVLETDTGGWAYLQGSRAEVEAQTRRLGGVVSPGFVWPQSPTGAVRISVRVPPGMTESAISRVRANRTTANFVAQHGVGEVSFSCPEFDLEGATGLRQWAESVGGSLVLVSAPDPVYDTFDPWGSDPPGLTLQRRLISAFDPGRVINPGRLPGRI